MEGLITCQRLVAQEGQTRAAELFHQPQSPFFPVWVLRTQVIKCINTVIAIPCISMVTSLSYNFHILPCENLEEIERSQTHQGNVQPEDLSREKVPSLS